MGQDAFIPVTPNARSRNDLIERGFTRQPLRIDEDVARSLEELSHAAWSIPRDKYYEGGDRYRSLNRVRAEIVEGGVKVWLSQETTPYVQLKKYNTTIGGQPREYAPLPPAIAGSIGVRKMIAHHLQYLPLSTVGTRYLVNVHLIRFTATPGRPCDTSPPGLHKDGEKYIATHLLGRCGSRHHHVQQNCIGTLLGGARHALRSRAGLDDFPTGYGLQTQRGYLTNIVFIVDDQNLAAHGGTSSHSIFM